VKGNPEVLLCLQDSLTSEMTLHLQYELEGWDLGRLGIDTKEGFGKLAEQSETFAHELSRRILFLEGQPVLDPTATTSYGSITERLNAAVAAELKIVQDYADYTKKAYDAGDMSNFHYFQHLSKWHREGDDKFKGHIAWIQKELWQVGRLGETAYVAEQIG